VAGGVDVVLNGHNHVYGVYRLILYPDHWVGAFKGVDGNTYDHTGQYCH
jgi:hypothetical protein